MFDDLGYLSGGLIVSDKEDGIFTVFSLQQMGFSGEYLTVFTDCPCEKDSVISLTKIEGIIAEHSQFFR